MRPPVRGTELLAAVWTFAGLWSVRRQLGDRQIDAIRLRPPPRPARCADRGVHSVLRRRPHSCLEGALVLQRWYTSQGQPREVVIGVTAPGQFRAHAWLDGEPTCHHEAFVEILRLPAR